MTVPVALLRAAVALRAASPSVWTTFLSELGGLAHGAAGACVTADASVIGRAQGRALALAELHSVLSAAPETVEKLETKSNIKARR